MSSIDLGVLTNPQLGSLHDLTISEPTDVFEFQLTSTRNINLALTNISAGDDADLTLFRDSNNSGVLDAGDQTIAFSRLGSNLDDSINLFSREPGTYFAEVSRFANGSSGNVTYDLHLSSSNPNASGGSAPSDLLPTEVEVGTLENSIRTFSGSVGSNDTTDVYHVSLTRSDLIVSLTGLSSDADVRIINDRNSNGVVDAGEQFRISANGGSASESFGAPNLFGDFFVQVFQFRGGDTNYQLSLNAFDVPS